MAVAGMRTVIPTPGLAPRPWATAVTTYVPAPSIDRWMGGVTFTPRHCGPGEFVGGIVDPCIGRVDLVDEVVGFEDFVHFDAFVLKGSFQCSPLSIDGAELQAIANEATLMERSMGLAAEVERAALSGSNPSLASAADTLTSTDQTAVGALAIVEDALAQTLNGGLGMIHMTPRVFTILQGGGGLMFEGGVWRTATGHFIVADAGYTGPDPDAGATATESWIYGSGPVYFVLADSINVLGLPYENFNYVHDDLNVHVEQYGLAYFEPCAVVAAEVDVTAVT